MMTTKELLEVLASATDDGTTQVWHCSLQEGVAQESGF
jgi:hypothetical protein